ncbi:hypothetical protein K469DRAFT_792975 [Zopfia rhizophila CBS 207.26]|uniref:Uncharacterized protein n=1 Tax=Zopfia rhizophila CBS 207.26 TaxID=1314779 RepID=A0A6A6DSB1_9PEZI|nr:hypothetical protein K469DRAFT_792975 [Zopfia rhizophila CBS 207.26]
MSCCLDGEVDLPLYGPLPRYLRNLFLGNDVRGREFRTNLRAYNAAFAFTSLNYIPTDCGVSAGGVQVFQIHGALYHLYFYNPQYAVDARVQRNPQLNL